MRSKEPFDNGWLFHLGDIECPLPTEKGPIYSQSKTEQFLWGPASRNYNAMANPFIARENQELCTEKWEKVKLPHDYIIGQTPKKEFNSALGFFDYQNGWYRKTFRLDEKDFDKRISLYFEGIATHATIYLNGCLVKRNYCGYNSFEVDITDFVRFGDENNILAVYVKTDSHEGWWYEGGGIYRHVWLCKTEKVYIDLWGVYVVPQKTGADKWNVKIETTVVNDTPESVTVNAVTSLYNKSHELLTVLTGGSLCNSMEKTTLHYETTVQNPLLWSIGQPNLYTVETLLLINGTECDRYITRTGFRTVRLDPDNGLFLNDEPCKIKGVCAHQDFGLTGKAVADNIQRYKITLLKEMGANGYRTSHYPHSETTMDALDEAGFLVMDETRWFSTEQEAQEQLKMLVKRDRNRPSVIFWSIGNEEPFHKTENGKRIAQRLRAFVKKLDDSRWVTTAVSNDPENAPVQEIVDVIGVNYNLQSFDLLHKKYPNKPILSSECCATGTTRGWYWDDCAEKGFLNAIDKDYNNYFLSREKTWKFMTERKWILGAYQWIAFEHRGEANWPRLCSQSGAIDLYLQKKDAFYQNRSLWMEDQPVIHLLPHWNFEGMEGEPIRVVVYTNCETVRLTLNNTRIGEKTVEKSGHAEWMVPYQRGNLKAEGFIGKKPVCSDSVKTAGKAVALKLKAENQICKGNGEDVALITCYCVDENGTEVPTVTPFVHFHCNKLGEIIGTGSDITDCTPVTATDRKMRAGRITVALRTTAEEGDIILCAESDGLLSALIHI